MMGTIVCITLGTIIVLFLSIRIVISANKVDDPYEDINQKQND